MYFKIKYFKSKHVAKNVFQCLLEGKHSPTREHDKEGLLDRGSLPMGWYLN